MTITITYQAKTYDPSLVTGKYVRCEGRKPNYIFKVFEAASRNGKAGHGPTLREYYTTGNEIPEDVRNRAIESKTTELWEYVE